MSRIYPHRKNYGYCVFPRLRCALRASGKDYKEIAKCLGISTSNFYFWMIGGNARTLLVISKLLQVTGLSFDEAFGEIDAGEGGREV